MSLRDHLNIEYNGFSLLLHGSISSIPFNIFLASLLSLDLIYNGVPTILVAYWFLSILFLSIIRWFYSMYVLKRMNKKKSNTLANYKIFEQIFIVFTAIMGAVWGVSYLLFLNYLAPLQEFIIILVFGGMCAGSVASLSANLPAYIAYISPMFLPVIMYNLFSNNFDRIILSVMFLLFISMLMISAKLNNRLYKKIFHLSKLKGLLIEKLTKLSVTDELTGLFNMRQFKKMVPKELKRAKRNHYPFNVIMIDIDNFKLINDHFGHPFGDKFLAHFADLLKGCLRRENDKLFRLGGDEFAVTMANLPLEDVQTYWHKIQARFEEDKIPEDGKVNSNEEVFSQVTVSIGITHIPYDSDADSEKIISLADNALYKAKRQGKNEIVLKTIQNESA